MEAYSANKIDEMKEGWEQIRLQTFYYISAQPGVDKVDYETFKSKWMKFKWDEERELINELPEIDFEARERELELRKLSTKKQIILE